MDEMLVAALILRISIEKGWSIQPDQKKRKALFKTMAKKAKENIIICPCKAFVEGLIPIADVACPCAEAEEDIKNDGSCHCGMFCVKKPQYGKYATPIIACSAKPGICHTGGDCEDCEFKDKYEANKRLFELVKNCECRNSCGICCVSCEECKGSECESIIYALQHKS
ncbi:MAG: ferredoxin-thioredoxin reductase catalytic domain-containing protein [Candidatus Pacebacteria bacterium]|nr:ferredoxin-thioredoxin reductase catalytic domain-containing protein [Fermentimonas sp.]MDD4804428.1 ferredoxin-thioredoxin reductase catalytic domain-containing protein [Candidatus Paceibacterota bacterium]